MPRAISINMKNKKLIIIFLILLWPICIKADDQKPDANINERYTVEGISFAGIDGSKISENLRNEARKMVGEKFSDQSADAIAQGLRKEFKGCNVSFKVERGEKPENVKVVFQVERKHGRSIDFRLPFVYHSKEGFSGELGISYRSHHDDFSSGMVSDADELLERYTGYRFSYEHRKLGTEAVRFRMDFDTYHESFNAATRAALTERPDVPGVYRARQNFAPSLTVIPIKGLSVGTGLSFQRLQLQFPQLHTETAYSGTADIQYHRKSQDLDRYRQEFSAAYSLRTATRILDSDLVYTRQLLRADYTLSIGRNLFGVHFMAGGIGGNAPLFERFSMGNSATLRGWNKFDVAPLGGTRAVQGSLEYRYRDCQIFYDVGSVWDEKRFSEIRHGLGFGWASKRYFVSLAFPVRLHNVVPVFMFGIRD
jgi:outer membrane protein assembly factor BamA